MKKINLIKFFLYLIVYFYSSSVSSYILKPLSEVIKDENMQVYLLVRCNAWHTLIAELAQSSNDTKTYNKHFKLSLDLYDLGIRAFMEVGQLKETEAEKKYQNDLSQTLEIYKADAEKNIDQFGTWYSGYFAGRDGDAQICDEYYEKSKDLGLF